MDQSNSKPPIQAAVPAAIGDGSSACLFGRFVLHAVCLLTLFGCFYIVSDCQVVRRGAAGLIKPPPPTAAAASSGR
jgi:hypothetical protein